MIQRIYFLDDVPTFQRFVVRQHWLEKAAISRQAWIDLPGRSISAGRGSAKERPGNKGYQKNNGRYILLCNLSCQTFCSVSLTAIFRVGCRGLCWRKMAHSCGVMCAGPYAGCFIHFPPALAPKNGRTENVVALIEASSPL